MLIRRAHPQMADTRNDQRGKQPLALLLEKESHIFWGDIKGTGVLRAGAKRTILGSTKIVPQISRGNIPLLLWRIQHKRNCEASSHLRNSHPDPPDAGAGKTTRTTKGGVEMTGEKENRKYYQNTFHEVHASKHLLRKVEAKIGRASCRERVSS